MPKQCKYDKCKSPVFSHGYCKYHQRFREDYSPIVPRKRGKAISASDNTIHRIKQAKIDAIGSRCEMCGRWAKVDYVHIIRKSDSLFFRDCARNGILGCRSCHDIFDQNMTVLPVSELFRLHHWRMRSVLFRMMALDVFYYNRFVDRHNLHAWL